MLTRLRVNLRMRPLVSMCKFHSGEMEDPCLSEQRLKALVLELCHTLAEGRVDLS